MSRVIAAGSNLTGNQAVGAEIGRPYAVARSQSYIRLLHLIILQKELTTIHIVCSFLYSITVEIRMRW